MARNQYEQTTSKQTPNGKTGLTDKLEYEQCTTSQKNTGTKTAPVNKAREGYHQVTTSLKTGTKS